MMLERNRETSGDEVLKNGEEWVTVTDFETGQPKRIKRVKNL